MKKYVKIRFFCEILMPSEKDNTLQLNKYMKSNKMSYIIHADIESLIKKIDECPNSPENSSTAKIGERVPCGYSMSIIWEFDHIEEKHTIHRGED